MQINGTDISVHRGEMFSIDYVLVNRNGTPYIFPKSNTITNPYFLITVASTKYYQDGRYLKNWWLKIPESMLFENTNPVPKPNGQPTVSPNAAVYYSTNESGEVVYERWNGSSFEPYMCRIVKTFTTEETLEWTAQSYVYSISYVDGELMSDYLLNLYKQHISSNNIPTSKYELYKALIEYDSSYASIAYERELHKPSISIPIITPSKLSIIDEVQGGLR